MGSWACFSWTLAGLFPACCYPLLPAQPGDRVSLPSGWALELPDPREPSFSCLGQAAFPKVPCAWAYAWGVCALPSPPAPSALGVPLWPERLCCPKNLWSGLLMSFITKA